MAWWLLAGSSLIGAATAREAMKPSSRDDTDLTVIHIPMYACLVAYSAATSLIAGCSPLTMCMYYVTGLGVFYAWHRLAHFVPTGPMYEIHMIHHAKHFPPDDYYGDESKAIASLYGSVAPTTMWDLTVRGSEHGTYRWAHEGVLVAGFGALLFAGRVVCGSSIVTIIFAALMYSVMGVLGTALHMSYHIKNFRWGRYPWFRELRRLHVIHHQKHANFAMLNTALDATFNSLAT